MHTAEIRLKSSALASSLSEMRSWLDGRRFEPASFDYFQDAASLIVRVSFKGAEQARAFAVKFGGTVRSSAPPSGEILSLRAEPGSPGP
jgi:hypothetical protein